MKEDKNRYIPELICKAYEAGSYAYAPYSHFQVGAALLCKDGTIYTGCNVENAAYSPSNCAERTALFKAVSEGKRDFEAVAIAGKGQEYLSPCGVCRQVLMEFCDPYEFMVILAKNEQDYKCLYLHELLPFAFSREDLAEESGQAGSPGHI